jgi:hypothetical protein
VFNDSRSTRALLPRQRSPIGPQPTAGPTPAPFRRPATGGCDEPSSSGPHPAAVAVRAGTVELRDGRPSPWRMHPVVAVNLVLAVEAYLLYITPPVVIGFWLMTLLAVQTAVATYRGRRIALELARSPSVGQVACVVADALRSTGHLTRGAEAVRVDERTGRFTVIGVHGAAASVFAAALDEVLAPMPGSPCLVRQRVLRDPGGIAVAFRVALGRLPFDRDFWRVPRLLAASEGEARAFAVAWDHWVGGDAVVVHPAMAGVTTPR